MRSVSVNLLLYQPKFYLRPCLDSILEQDYQDYELLIIDNNSGDGTAEQVRKILVEAQKSGQRLPSWRLVENKQNLGYAAAHNLGISASRGELVFLLNQDIILETDFLKNVAAVFEQNEKIAAVQGKLLRLKVVNEELIRTQIIDNTGLVVFKNRRIVARGQGQNDSGQFDRQQEIFGVDGAAPIYRRAALEDVRIKIKETRDRRQVDEFLDEDFYMYKEDVDLAWRLRLAGWRAYYEPTATAWHARTAGDSAATGYLEIIKERRKINRFGKYLSFKNQRLMQIKNEQLRILFKHLFWLAPKEVASWVYVALFERYTWRAIRDLFKQTPRAWQKRKIIMARKKVNSKEMEKWFE